NVAALGFSPTAADLASYKMVIWNTGYDFSSAILPADEAAISAYLDNGGRIYISGQDVFWSGVSANFQTSYLKVADYFDDLVTFDHTETGIAGHPIGRNLSLTATLPPGFNSFFVDELLPTPDAEGFLLHNDPSGFYPFSSVSYRGDYDNGGFGMVFTTLPFESISPFDVAPNDSATVMRRIIEYLIGPLPGTIDIELPVYGLNQAPLITVRDSAPNVDYFAVDTTTVEVYSTSELTPITVVLTETDVDSGVFTGTFQLGPAPVDSADSILQVVHNDIIIAVLPASGRFDTAIVDGLPPNASNIAATAHPTRANITWNTDEDSFEQILVGTSPTSLSLLYDGTGFGSSHLMTVSGLVPDTQYYYQIISTDALGNSGASEINSFVTTIAQPILVIDDDLGGATEQAVTNALAANLFTSDSWDLLAENGQPLAGDLNAYRMVIWNTGFDFSTALTAADELAISTYLNNGGRIFISGQDVLFSGVSTGFRTNYLKVDSYEDDVQLVDHNEVGVSGHPIGNGMNIPVAANADIPELYVDALTPAVGATGFLRHGVTTASS
ncbi:MAG: fibronectin type III domain-containing protein, partial [Planctomyces sp.]